MGYLCSFSPALAEAVVARDGLAALTSALGASGTEPVQCAAAWALGQAGRHRAAHAQVSACFTVPPCAARPSLQSRPLCATPAQAVAESGALLALAGLEVSPQSSEDLGAKCGRAAAAVVAKLESLPALDALARM